MNYHKITYPDIENGEGVRLTLWVSGCSHHCPGCHNPETWSPNGGKPFTKETVQEIVDILDDKDYLDGVTLSGGDPLYMSNISPIYNLCRMLKKRYPQKTIWLYTGYQYEWIMRRPVYAQVMQFVDVLVDGEYDEEKRDISLPFCGSSNQRLIDVNESRKTQSVVLWKPKD